MINIDANLRRLDKEYREHFPSEIHRKVFSIQKKPEPKFINIDRRRVQTMFNLPRNQKVLIADPNAPKLEITHPSPPKKGRK